MPNDPNIQIIGGKQKAPKEDAAPEHRPKAKRRDLTIKVNVDTGGPGMSRSNTAALSQARAGARDRAIWRLASEAWIHRGGLGGIGPESIIDQARAMVEAGERAGLPVE